MKASLKTSVECDNFVAALSVKTRNCLLRNSLNTEQRIRDSFARDGGKSIAEIDNFGGGSMAELRDALEVASDGYESR